jgi:sulfofructosephosphate aldolase
VTATLAALARPSGAFAMLALDQREGLRTMLQSAGRRSDHRALTEFKVAAARALAGSASAVLIDVEYGLAAVREAGAIPPGCALIVAADRLTQAPGGPVEWTEVDDAVLADDEIASVADAYKLLVIVRPGEESARARIVEAFVRACRARKRPAIVEGIVRGDDGTSVAARDHADRVIDAAVELTSLGADLYKAEIPTLGAADDGAIQAVAERLTTAIPRPWVVLSNGTPAERFDGAMLAACRGGASGFLAGRAIWSASIAAPNPETHLATVAAPRLATLGAAVDEAVRARTSR